MSSLEVTSWRLGKHLSEVALGELTLFGALKADCPPDVPCGFCFKNQQVLLSSTDV